MALVGTRVILPGSLPKLIVTASGRRQSPKFSGFVAVNRMATPYRDSANAPPIVMRWRETVLDGVRHWYLASLRDDASFWGYVHVRTDALSENRSFDGQLSRSKYTRIRSLVDSVDADDAGTDAPGFLDGLIGLGSRSDFTTIVRYNPEPPELPNAELFRDIVDLLQPEVISAADL